MRALEAVARAADSQLAATMTDALLVVLTIGAAALVLFTVIAVLVSVV
jgi:hypothetical protein